MSDATNTPNNPNQRDILERIESIPVPGFYTSRTIPPSLPDSIADATKHRRRLAEADAEVRAELERKGADYDRLAEERDRLAADLAAVLASDIRGPDPDGHRDDFQVCGLPTLKGHSTPEDAARYLLNFARREYGSGKIARRILAVNFGLGSASPGTPDAADGRKEKRP